MTDKDNLAKLESVFSRVLQVNLSEIGDETALESLSSWDSFNALMLVAEMEKAFGIHFTVSEMTEMKNVGAIKQALGAKGIEI